MLSWLQRLLGWQCCSSNRLRGEKLRYCYFLQQISFSINFTNNRISNYDGADVKIVAATIQTTLSS